jgi:hypothetical protein
MGRSLALYGFQSGISLLPRISGLREIGPRQTDFIRESLLAWSDFPSLGTFWQPMHDGRHFLVLRTAEPAPGKPIMIVTNWQAALKK